MNIWKTGSGRYRRKIESRNRGAEKEKHSAFFGRSLSGRRSGEFIVYQEKRREGRKFGHRLQIISFSSHGLGKRCFGFDCRSKSE